MPGGASLIVTLMYATDEPPEFVAVIVNCVLVSVVLGVPPIIPLTILKWNILSKFGEIV